MKLREVITCRITPYTLHLNGSVKFSSNAADAEAFFKELYQFLGIDYPKFFKMDHLSKLGFLAVEAIVRHHPAIKAYADDALAIVCAGKHSSLDTDVAYWEGVMANPPLASPALFVYTLPNIVLGEIAIRHKWHGENVCLILESPDHTLLEKQAELLLASGKAEACLTGWIDIYQDVFEAEFRLLHGERVLA